MKKAITEKRLLLDRQTVACIAAIIMTALFCFVFTVKGYCETSDFYLATKNLIHSHQGKSGAYVLEKGEESLIGRGWLAKQALNTIDVRYFIWSTDNVGILAAETLLEAANRGVNIRVIVDDLLIDAPNDIMIALARHPKIQIRIYNPKHKVGISTIERLYNVLTDFRGVNQRMHDKSFSVDGQIAITGGRNMADEYFDFNHDYNFRDRDILLIGPVVSDINKSFQSFWDSHLAVPVEVLLQGALTEMSEEQITRIYAELHEYAQNPDNFEPEIRKMIENIPEKFSELLGEIVWEEIRFISDTPGKNSGEYGLGGGSATTEELISAIKNAKKRIAIQSPYLVMPEGGIELFNHLIQKGVSVRISTNSLCVTDNLKAFSGYARQRKELLEAGIDIYEFRPDSERKKQLIDRYDKIEEDAPVFAIHAKTMIIDGETLFVGTYNFDPRSANLNTEVLVKIKNTILAEQVEKSIKEDMKPENSWHAETSPDTHASWSKRIKLQLWKLLPLNPLL